MSGTSIIAQIFVPLIIMDDYMQLLVPKRFILWEISVFKLKFKRLTNFKNRCFFAKMAFSLNICNLFLCFVLISGVKFVYKKTTF